jgi:SAM-dependent methyltransferase
VIPRSYVRWNRRHGAPRGRPGRRLDAFAPTLAWARWRGPFAWQGNNLTRTWEYPWAFHQTAARGRPLRIAEVGGGLSGLQWVLARGGHRVINIDPGPSARGLGWELDPARHARLSRAFGAPVELRATTLSDAGLADSSVDVLLAVSVLEHFAPEDIDDLASHARRVLAPGGIAVLTVDLFLDVEPFTSARCNRYGRNVDLRAFLDHAGLVLLRGDPAELRGFPQFSADAIQCRLSRYFVGDYPTLAQCIVATSRGEA